MKFLIFGDVHGNLPALEKLFQIEKGNFDMVICHGDVVNYGPWSNECVTFLASLPHKTLLAGNHESYFISGIYPGENIIARSFFEHCYPNFNKALIPELCTYENERLIPGYSVRHTIGDKYIFADTDLSDFNACANFIIGHSHQQYARIVDGYKIYNTGSVGQNRKYINQSCYIIYDTDTAEVTLNSYLHDINYVINEMKATGYPAICINYYLSKERMS